MTLGRDYRGGGSCRPCVVGSIMGPSRCPAPRLSTGGRTPSGSAPTTAFRSHTCTTACGPGRDPRDSRGSASLVLCLPRTHMVLLSLHPPPPLSLSSLASMTTHHPLACIPASARDSGLSSSRPSPSSGALVPAVLSPPPGVSPEAASLFRLSHPFSALPSRLLRGDHLPSPASTGLQPHQRFQKSHPQHRQGLWPVLCSGTLPCQPPMPRSALSVISFCHRLGKQARSWS